jgi:thiamine-phosphate pyrophosphorylase
MPFTLPRIYPVTDRNISGLSHAEQVTALVEGGGRLIQLREKNLSGREFFEDAKHALFIAHAAGVKLLINDRVDLAMALGADGVHLGQADLPPVEVRKLLGENAIIGFSTHNIEQAAVALEMPIDYIAIGPVFATSTKVNPDPVVGLDGIRSVRRIADDRQIVAIGGITETSLAGVFEAGADSAAMIGTLLGNGSRIAETMHSFLSR